jgi:glycosyltransferase involved in cell wall biosynthesis
MKKRIGIDARILAYPRSGIGAYLVGLLDELKGFADIEPVLFSDRPLLSDYDDAVHGLETVVTDESTRKHWANRHLAPVLKKHSIDLYHAVWDAGIPFFAHCPSILTLHSITPFKRAPYATVDMIRNPRKRLMYRMTFEIEYRLAKTLLVTSDYMKEYIHAHAGVPYAKMRTMYLGVDRMFRPISDAAAIAGVVARYGLTGSSYFLAVPSRIMEERKNMPMIVKGFAAYCRRMPESDAVLAVVGEWKGVDEQAKARLFSGIEPSVIDRIKIVGHAPREDLAHLLCGSTALIYPSLYEGFGLPLVEGFACGTPVLSSTTSCIPEVAGDAALLVDPFSAEALGDAMVRLQADGGLRTRLREAGLAKAKMYSWKNNAARTREIYLEFIEKGKTR